MPTSILVLGFFWVLEFIFLIVIGILWCLDRTRTVNVLPGILMILFAIKKLFLLIPAANSLSLFQASLSQIDKPFILPAIFFQITIVGYQGCLIYLQFEQARLVKKAVKDVRR